MKYIVTSGRKYIDIDAYAGCIAYAELLQKQGLVSEAVSTGPWNESIPPSLRVVHGLIAKEYTATASDVYVVIDVSDPEHFDTFVDIDRVHTVIDHHPGFEDYWQKKIGDNAHIEFIGAACTQVYELWKAANLLPVMSPFTARLLCAGVLDNTLDFRAHVTTERDRVAYQDLLHVAGLTTEWSSLYFAECQNNIVKDIEGTIINDTKMLIFHGLKGSVQAQQLVVWDAKSLLNTHGTILYASMGQFPRTFMNLVSIKEGKSYFLASDHEVKAWLSGLLGIDFNNSLATADRLWLRKEIMKQDSASSVE